MKEKIKIIVCGACGRMGTLVLKLALESESFEPVAAIEKRDHPMIGKTTSAGMEVTDNLDFAATGKEVIIDFTEPAVAIANAGIAAEKKNALVIGTTGFSGEQISVIQKASSSIPVLLSPNMSIGVNCFFEIVKFAAGLLKEYEIEIVETHHHHKKDAPSGTAKKVAEIICSSLEKDMNNSLKYGRSGITGARDKREIGIHSIRLGDVVGDHSVLFGGKGDVLEVTHRCYNRETFASGALQCAQFVYGKEPGFYNMKDVLTS